MKLRGKSPTDVPDQFTARLGNLEATAQVEVVLPPFELEITPAGPISVPAGQSVSFRVWSAHADDRASIEPDRVAWNVERNGGDEFSDGTTPRPVLVG